MLQEIAIGLMLVGGGVLGYGLVRLRRSLFPTDWASVGNTVPQQFDDGRTAAQRANCEAIHKGICPDCGENGTLLAGPSGGMSQNIGCNSCLMEFNVHHSFNGVLAVDRTGFMSQGRAAVFGISDDEYRDIAQANGVTVT